MFGREKEARPRFFSGTKVKLDWPDSHTDASGIAFSQKMSRLLLNLMIIAGASLIRGGTLSIRVSEPQEGEKHVEMVAEGETIKLDADTVAILQSNHDDVLLTPKTCQPFLAMKLAQEVGASLKHQIQGNRLEISVVQRQMAMAHAS